MVSFEKTENMTGKTALIAGASGLTGSCLLGELLAAERYSKVIVYVRRTMGIEHPKLEEKLVDFETLQEGVFADDVFCCLGTTIKKAGSKEAFRKVDLDYPVKLANLQYKAGATQFLVVSAMGAAIDSTIFYSKIKGEMEAAVQTCDYTTVCILRPSLIMGNRKEKRTGERWAQNLAALIDPLFIGPLRKYRSVTALAIARALLHEASRELPGNRILLSDEIKAFE